MRGTHRAREPHVGWGIWADGNGRGAATQAASLLCRFFSHAPIEGPRAASSGPGSVPPCRKASFSWPGLEWPARHSVRKSR